MRSILLGTDAENGADVRIPESAFATHFHLIGGTGKGKTTALHTMLQPLMSNPFEKPCVIIIDRLGNFSQELLLWMSSRFCPEAVRKRLVYIQAAREDVVATFNPLLYESSAHAYYKVERATEIILRAWESVNIEAMPRLARWTFNAFSAASQLGLTIADCVHFLMPGSPYHARLLERLPDRLRGEWEEIKNARGQEAMRILDSSRNRLKPYFESDILRRIFGSSQHRLDMLRMMEEGRILLVDLAPRNRLSGQLANTIGALIINEVIATVRSLPRGVKYRTYLFLDEFQNFVGPDLESALPETRQLGLNLVLSHQSFAQLERGDYDLSGMIFAAQSRMIFGVQGEDADILAHEVASLTFDAKRVKEELYSRRQLLTGHRLETLEGGSEAETSSSQDSTMSNKSTAASRGESARPSQREAQQTRSDTETSARGEGRSSGSSHATTRNWHQTLVPEHEEFMELSSRTYSTFEEQKSEWAREIRQLRTGEAILRLVNDGKLYRVNVKRSAPGFLGYDMQTLARKLPHVLARMDRMIEENFQSEFFVSAETVDREIEQRVRGLLQGPPIVIQATPEVSEAAKESEKNSAFVS
jgi:hypothetical protein